jgi:hypothetical protein
LDPGRRTACMRVVCHDALDRLRSGQCTAS